MVKTFSNKLQHGQITPPDVFFNRRDFMKLGAGGGIIGGLSAMCGPVPPQDPTKVLKIPLKRPEVFPPKRNGDFTVPKAIPNGLTPRMAAATHNNFYEFLSGQGGPVYRYVDDFEPVPWKIKIGGLCNNPMTLDLDDLFAFPHEERLYHFRCVERWAMTIPWSGFPLATLIKKADPKSEARYVRFVSAKRPKQMPGLASSDHYPWPYHEALRLDEAMNELAMVVTGVYGEPLPIQHGSPLRIIVPWKYGFKSPKTIVKIELVKKQPKTFWMVQPHEYGFISNVNPNIPHPRWSQATSHWLHNQETFPTPIFNGYESYVGKLYPSEPRTPQKPLRSGQIAR